MTVTCQRLQKSELRGEETPPEVGAEASRIGLHAEPLEPAAQTVHVTMEQGARIGIRSRVRRPRKVDEPDGAVVNEGIVSGKIAVNEARSAYIPLAVIANWGALQPIAAGG